MNPTSDGSLRAGFAVLVVCVGAFQAMLHAQNHGPGDETHLQSDTLQGSFQSAGRVSENKNGWFLILFLVCSSDESHPDSKLERSKP